MFDGGYGGIGNQEQEDRKGNADLQKIKNGTEANNEFQFLKIGTPAGLAATEGPAGLAAAKGPPEMVGMMTAVAGANSDHQMMEDEDNNCHTEGEYSSEGHLITQSTGGGGQPVDNPNREVCKLNSQHYMDNYEYPDRNDKLRDDMVVDNNAQNDGKGDGTDVRGGQNIVEIMDEDNTPSKNGKWDGKGGRDGQNEITMLDNECRVLSGIVKNRGSGTTGNGREEGTEMETKNHSGNGEDINMGDQVICIERETKNRSIHIADDQFDIETDLSKKLEKQIEIGEDLSGGKTRSSFVDGDQVSTKMDTGINFKNQNANEIGLGAVQNGGKNGFGFGQNNGNQNPQLVDFVEGVTRNTKQNGGISNPKNLCSYVLQMKHQQLGKKGLAFKQKSHAIPVNKNVQKRNRGRRDQFMYSSAVGLKEQNGEKTLYANKKRKSYSTRIENRTCGQEAEIMNGNEKSNTQTAAAVAAGFVAVAGHAAQTTTRIDHRNSGQETEIMNGNEKTIPKTADVVADVSVVAASPAAQTTPSSFADIVNGNEKFTTREAAEWVSGAAGAVTSTAAADQKKTPSFADILKGNEMEEEVTKMEYIPPAFDATGN